MILHKNSKTFENQLYIKCTRRCLHVSDVFTWELTITQIISRTIIANVAHNGGPINANMQNREHPFKNNVANIFRGNIVTE